MNPSVSVEIPDQVMARKVGEETVVLNLESGIYFGLDSVGTRIWELLTEGNSFTEICDTMTEEFNVDRDTLEEDVKELVRTLKDKGLICINEKMD